MPADTVRSLLGRGRESVLGHPFRATSIALVAAAVVAAAVVVPIAGSEAAHADALRRYHSDVTALASLTVRLDGAATELAAARADLVGVDDVLATLRATPEGVLPPEHHALLDAAADADATALAQPTGEQPTAQEAVAGETATTTTIRAAHDTLARQLSRERRWLHITDDALRATRTREAITAETLRRLVTGAPADGDQPAIPALAAVSASVLDAYPRADASTRAALTAAATTAATAADADATVSAELLAFVARARDVHDSQDTADRAAAEAAARAAEEARRAAEDRAATRSGGAGGSGGGSGSGGSRQVTLPPPPDFTLIAHNPQVYANGDYVPGCVGVPASTRQAANHGYEIITLEYDSPYTYETFSTPDGWGLTVYDCS